MGKTIKSKCKPATKAELAWIERLQKLCDKVPNKKIWLFSASGDLMVMKSPENGEEMLPNGGVNGENIIGQIYGMRNDGGDW